MLVVSDTSPVLNLALIGQLDLLVSQFGEVILPDAVVNELRLGEDVPGSGLVSRALEAGWLRSKAVQDEVRVAILQRDLDRGEAETIALALEVQADWLLLDEREGRRIAKSLGLAVTGVLGILLRARLTGELASLSAAMNALREEAGFWIRDDLYVEFLRAAGEGQAPRLL